MLFSELTQPSTIAVSLVDAALFGLALAVASGRLVRPVRWLARGLAAMTLVMGLGFAAGMILELATYPLPFARPDAPLGTYADMTQLGLLVGAATLGLAALGSALAFRWRGPGGLLLVAVGICGVLDSLRSLFQDPTLPTDSFVFGLQLNVFILAVGTVVLGLQRAERAGASNARPRSATTHRSSPASRLRQAGSAHRGPG